jgi:hypothetical protein
MGWDNLRETIYENQKKLGVLPPDAELTPRPAELPAWDSLRLRSDADTVAIGLYITGAYCYGFHILCQSSGDTCASVHGPLCRNSTRRYAGLCSSAAPRRFFAAIGP